MGSLFLPLMVFSLLHLVIRAIAAASAGAQRRERAIGMAAWDALDAPAIDATGRTVTGTRLGMGVTFYLHGGAAHIEVDVRQSDVVVALRPRLTPARAHVERGAVRSGDRRFDADYLVEGAPADGVRCLLSPELRAEILDVRAAVTLSGSTLELSSVAPLEPTAVRPLIELAARLAASVPDALAEADDQLVVVGGAPYRPEVDASQVRAAQATRTEELAGFVALLRERAVSSTMALVVAGVVGAILVACMVTAR